MDIKTAAADLNEQVVVLGDRLKAIVTCIGTLHSAIADNVPPTDKARAEMLDELLRLNYSRKHNDFMKDSIPQTPPSKAELELIRLLTTGASSEPELDTEALPTLTKYMFNMVSPNGAMGQAVWYGMRSDAALSIMRAQNPNIRVELIGIAPC